MTHSAASGSKLLVNPCHRGSANCSRLRVEAIGRGRDRKSAAHRPSSGRARAQRQPGALTAAMATHHSHTPSPGARVHSRQCLFNHLPGQLCHCRIGGADYLPRKLQQFIQASARGIHNMAPSKLTVVVALVASLLLLLCNSNTKVTTEQRVDASARVRARKILALEPGFFSLSLSSPELFLL
jgi:hypothetical protein